MELPAFEHFTGIGHYFQVLAKGETGQELSLSKPVTIAIEYEDVDVGQAKESTLGLFYWDGTDWIKEPASRVDPERNTIITSTNRFSLWAVLGSDKIRLFAPFVYVNSD